MQRQTIQLIVILALVLLIAPLAADAQPAGKVWRIGMLFGSVGPESPMGVSFRQGLRDLGYIEGQNIAFEWRLSGGQAERLPSLAAELGRLPVDVIVAGDNPAIAAAQQATSTIPIVMVLAMDPVRTGFVSSLARPGGNITGLTFPGHGHPRQSAATPQGCRAHCLPRGGPLGCHRARAPRTGDRSGGGGPRLGAGGAPARTLINCLSNGL
jgi:ABC transporter substrate binding protein